MSTSKLPSARARIEKHGSPVNSRQVERVIAELVTDGSIELIAARDQTKIDQAKALLPDGMSVYIPGLPGRPLMSK